LEEIMHYLVFRRENNKFDDILKDKNIKPIYKTKIQYYGNLILGFTEDHDDTSKILSYIILKYGDDIVTLDIPDRTPIPHKDYIPKKKNRT
jgi:hypothetical protein